jgi:hypothetical protein
MVCAGLDFAERDMHLIRQIWHSKLYLNTLFLFLSRERKKKQRTLTQQKKCLSDPTYQ